MEHTLAIVKWGAQLRGALLPIRAQIKEDGFKVICFDFFGPEAESKYRELYREHADKHYFGILMGSVVPGSYVMVLARENAVAHWRNMQGPTDPVRARKEEPECIRARFGGSELPDNATHGSDSVASAMREIEIFYPGFFQMFEEALPHGAVVL